MDNTPNSNLNGCFIHKKNNIYLPIFVSLKSDDDLVIKCNKICINGMAICHDKEHGLQQYVGERAEELLFFDWQSQTNHRFEGKKLHLTSLNECENHNFGEAELLIEDLKCQLYKQIRPLKASTHLLCKAEQNNTRQYLAELVNTTTSEIESIVDDISLLSDIRSTKVDHHEVKRFLLAETIDLMVIDMQLFFKLRSVTFNVKQETYNNLYINLHQRYFTIFIERFIKLLTFFCYGQEISFSSILVEVNHQTKLLIEAEGFPKRANADNSIITLAKLLQGKLDLFSKELGLSLSDLLICNALIKPLGLTIETDNKKPHRLKIFFALQ